MSKWTYHTSHSYKTKNGTPMSFASQLYQIGVYAILNSDSAAQFNFTPGKIVSIEKKLRTREKKGDITDLVFGREITVSDDTGFFEEVK